MKKVLIFLSLLSLTSCQLNTANSQPPVTSPSPILTLSPSPIQLKSVLHLAIGLDRTGSKAQNKVPDMTREQIHTLAKGIQQQGGDLRVTTICSDSDKPMARLSFPPPAQPPNAPALAKVDKNGNALEQAKIREQNQTKLNEHQTALTAFNSKQKDQATNDQAQIDRFMEQVTPLLDQPATCTTSDMVGIVQRADLFLQERQPAGSKAPRKVLFLVTDGQHTASKASQIPTLQSKAEVVIVSGGQGAGIFEPLKPDKFDSINAAIAYILSR